MATLARRTIKALLFFALFWLSARYIYAPLALVPSWNQEYSIIFSSFLGFEDVELFDMLFGIVTSSGMASIEYTLIMKLWRHYRARRKDAVTS